MVGARIWIAVAIQRAGGLSVACSLWELGFRVGERDGSFCAQLRRRSLPSVSFSRTYLLPIM